MTFQLGYGVNIAHWLSQSERRGAERRAWFTEADVQRIASAGLDHVRVPVDETQLWSEAGKRDPEAFDLLEQALGWCRTARLRAIVDLHVVRCSAMNAAGRPISADPAVGERLCAVWDDLSEALAHWPADLVAYELLNEPVARVADDWNDLAARLLARIRRREPARAVAVDSMVEVDTDRFADPRAFADMRVPADPNLILTFHFYDPFLFTHYRAPWTPARVFAGPVEYPGEQASAADWAALTPAVRRTAGGERVFTATDMERVLEPALAVAKASGLPLWCGEFGALTSTPEPARERWYRDVISTLARHGIPATVWNYKGSEFGVFDDAGRPTLVHRALQEAIRG